MADKTRKPRLELLAEFDAAPPSALFPQPYIAALRDCSEANIARDRGSGKGVPFIRIGNRIFYRKSDYVAWEQQHQPVRSTAEARAQAMRLREEQHKPVRSTAEAAAQAMRLRREALSDAPSSAVSAERHKPIRSTAEADAQASRLRETALNVADRIAALGEG